MTISDTNWSLKERFTTDDISAVSAGIPAILLFLTRSFKEFKKKVAAQRPLDFSQTNYRLNEGFPHVFHRLFHPFREQQLGKNIFHLRGQRLLSLIEVYFQTS